MLRAILANIMKLCHASSKLNGNGADWIKTLEEMEKQRQFICQQLYGEELHKVFHVSLTGAQLRMLKPFQFRKNVVAHESLDASPGQ
jgi:hypothetical protein